MFDRQGARGQLRKGAGCGLVGWVELLRNPSSSERVSMGFASLNPSYRLPHIDRRQVLHPLDRKGVVDVGTLPVEVDRVRGLHEGEREVVEIALQRLQVVGIGARKAGKMRNDVV